MQAYAQDTLLHPLHRPLPPLPLPLDPLASPALPPQVVHLASIPESIAKPEALNKARERAVDVADWLGVSGLAQLDGYMHVDSGELIVSGLDLAPDLSAASPLYAQVGIMGRVL